MPTVLQWIAMAVGIVFVGTLLSLSTLLLVQIVIACVTRFRLETPVADGVRPRIAILIPAHNEAEGIGATLASIQPQLVAGDRLLVIADNCSDATAQVATALGAEVVERTDAVLRGKGYALDYGLRQLQSDAPDVVMMFDADCLVGPTSVLTLAVKAERLRHPIQALYIIRAAHDGVLARMSEFAYRLRNWARPVGMLRMGMPCQLMGSGMAFHWSLLSEVSLASGHLTEDLQLGLAFARKGRYARFAPDATVDSLFVVDAASATVQRTRWEHGHLGTIMAEWPSLARQSVRTLDLKLALMAWDLAVPPLALFSTVLLLAALAFAVLAVTGVALWPLVAIVVALSMLLLAVILVQRTYARDLIKLREIFVAVPLYLVRKAPVYLRFLFNRQVEWVRTKRDVG